MAPTTYKEQISKLTLDAGARALAVALDEMKARLDLCCGPEGATAAAKPARQPAPTAALSGDSSKD